MTALLVIAALVAALLAGSVLLLGLPTWLCATFAAAAVLLLLGAWRRRASRASAAGAAGPSIVATCVHQVRSLVRLFQAWRRRRAARKLPRSADYTAYLQQGLSACLAAAGRSGLVAHPRKASAAAHVLVLGPQGSGKTTLLRSASPWNVAAATTPSAAHDHADAFSLSGPTLTVPALMAPSYGAGHGMDSARPAPPAHLLLSAPGAARDEPSRMPAASPRPFLDAPSESPDAGDAGWFVFDGALAFEAPESLLSEDVATGRLGALLAVLRQRRRRKPLDAVVVTLSLDATLATSREAFAASLATRLADLDAWLGYAVPRYVVFTHADAICGFAEAFATLAPEKRAQPLGMTYPLSAPEPGSGLDAEAEKLATLDADLAELLDGMRRRVLCVTAEASGRQRQARAARLVFHFGQALPWVRSAVATLAKAPLGFSAPVLRGFYLTANPPSQFSPSGHANPPGHANRSGNPIASSTAGGQAAAPYAPAPSAAGFYAAGASEAPHPQADPGEIVIEVIGESHAARGVQDAFAPGGAPSLFASRLIQELIVPDGRLPAAGAGTVRQQVHVRLGVAALWVLALAGVGVCLVAWSQLGGEIKHTTSVWRQAERDARSASWVGVALRLKQIDARQVSTPLKVTGLAPASDGPLAEALRTYLVERADTDLVRPQVRSDEACLERLVREAPPAEDRRRLAVIAYGLPCLKRYLLLSVDAEGARRGLSPSQHEFLTDLLAQRLRVEAREQGAGTSARPQGLPSLEEARAAAGVVVSHYARLSLPEARQPLVAESRRLLGQLPPEQRLLLTLLDEVAQAQAPLTLRSLLGPHGTALTASETIHPGYTREGWLRRVRPEIERRARDLSEEAWILDETPSAAGDVGLIAGAGGAVAVDAPQRADRMIQAVRQAYFSGYIDEWRNFLASVRVRQPVGEMQSLTLLKDLTSGQPQLLPRLFAALAEHALLPEPEASLVQKVSSRLPTLAAVRSHVVDALGLDAQASPDGAEPDQANTAQRRTQLSEASVQESLGALIDFGVPKGEDNAHGTDLDVYQEQLVFLRDALQATLADPREGEALLARLAETRTRVAGLISSQSTGWKPRLSAWLLPPIEGLALSAARSQAAGSARAWCSEVALPFAQTLSRHYPFEAAGYDAALGDFEAFFKPQSGMLEAFVASNLASKIEDRGTSLAFAKHLGRGGATGFSPRLLRFLEQSRKVTRAFFPGAEAGADGGNGAQASFAFDVRLRPVPGAATVEFMVGGTRISHQNGPEVWTRVAWPGKQPAQGASVEVRGRTGLHERFERSGVWGLFRLLERASVRPGPGRTYTATFPLSTSQTPLVVELRATRATSPLDLLVQADSGKALLGGVHSKAPAQIALSGSHCQVGE